MSLPLWGCIACGPRYRIDAEVFKRPLGHSIPNGFATCNACLEPRRASNVELGEALPYGSVSGGISSRGFHPIS